MKVRDTDSARLTVRDVIGLRAVYRFSLHTPSWDPVTSMNIDTDSYKALSEYCRCQESVIKRPYCYLFPDYI